jgi:hypothetical protein
MSPAPPDRRWFLTRSLTLAAVAGTGSLAAAACASVDATSGSPGSSGLPSSPGGTAAATTSSAPTDPVGIATQAFLAGVPLVITRRTMQTFAGLGGVNTLIRTPGLGNPASRLVVAPNHDTTYVLAVLDLGAGPLLLTMPAIPDRYHVMQFLDAWMGGFGLIGSRTTGGVGGAFVLAPTGWDGPVPDGAERLECPTTHAMILGRIRAVDDEDARVAAAISRQITLTPLDPSAAPSTDASSLGPAPDPPQTVGENGAAFFDELGDALASDPPVTAEQRAALDAAAELGVAAGRHPSADPAVADTLATAVADGAASLDAHRSDGSTRINGWDVNLGLGTADTDSGVAGRAVIARYFWGPVPAEEAVYPRLAVADDGESLDGSKRYRLRFAADDLPPVDAFWSITAYGPDMFLVPNDQGRYSLSGDTPGLVVGDDGSIELFIQHDPPPGDEANWLPVPTGAFTLIMRLYLPRPAVVDGRWAIPPVTVA